MSTTWILIANSSTARIYQTHKAKLFKVNGHDEENINLLWEFSHDKSRSKVNELVTDRLGSYQTTNVGGHGSYAETTDLKLVEADRFARELVERLEEGRIKGEYDDIILVANPQFVGLLNKHMDQQLDKRVSNQIDKDYTHLKGRQLVNMLREHL